MVKWRRGAQNSPTCPSAVVSLGVETLRIKELCLILLAIFTSLPKYVRGFCWKADTALYRADILRAE